MTKSIQQVKQELEKLESTTAEIAIELKRVRLEYLKMLARSSKQQLISACYQICTQLYPRSFLDLSLGEKQDLQQKLRQLGIQLEPELIELIDRQELEPEPMGLNLMAELIKNLPKPKRKESTDNSEDAAEDTAGIDLELVKAELENIELIEIDTAEDALPDELNALTSPVGSAKLNPNSNTIVCNFKNPEHLILWHKQIERNIKKTLDTASRKINKYLQESRIIPDRIPSKVIDVAIQADSAKGMRNNSQQPDIPHVIHLAIENGSQDRPNPAKNVMQISLLRLRLAELEFSDPLLNVQRGQLRKLMAKIGQLNSKYQAIKHEAAIVEARSAWRASWYED